MRKILNLFSGENSLRGASLILVVTLACSNVLGLFRDRFLARNIAFADLDVYFAAFRIPDTLFNVLILGAISSAFIPIFSDLLSKNKEQEGFRLTSTLVNVAAVLMIIAASFFYFLMPIITRLVVPSFDSDRFAETVKVSRLLMLTPIFFSISYIIGGVLNSYKRFLSYALAPLIYNLAIIFGALIVAPKYGVVGTAYCVVVGSVLHILIQVPALIKVGYHHNIFAFDFRNEALKRIGKLMIPRSISLGANQLLFVVYTSIASSLAAGTIAAFNFSNNIQTVPVVVLGSSFAAAVFPTLSLKIAKEDYDGFTLHLSRLIRVVAFLLVPTSILFILLRAQIVRLILGSGKVGWSDTKMTALALGLFSLSFLAQGLTPLLIRAFFALKNTRLPMFISIISVAVSVAIAYPLAQKYSIAGLALSFSLGSFFQFVLLLLIINRINRGLCNLSLLVSQIRIILFSLLTGLSVWITMHLMANNVDMSRFVGVLLQTIVSALVGLICYLSLNYLTGSQELEWIINRKVRPRKDLDSIAEGQVLENTAESL